MNLYLTKISEILETHKDFKHSSNIINRLKNVSSIKRQNEIKATEILFSLVFEDYDIYTIGVSKNGKPFFNESKIKFNYSHSSNLLVLIVSNEDVGIDIERIDNKAKRAYKKFVLEDELKFILNDEFYTLLWTIKEASIKKFGLNLSSLENIKIIDIVEENGHFISYVKFKNNNFKIISFKIDDYFISYSGDEILKINNI